MISAAAVCVVLNCTTMVDVTKKAAVVNACEHQETRVHEECFAWVPLPKEGCTKKKKKWNVRRCIAWIIRFMFWKQIQLSWYRWSVLFFFPWFMFNRSIVCCYNAAMYCIKIYREFATTLYDSRLKNIICIGKFFCWVLIISIGHFFIMGSVFKSAVRQNRLKCNISFKRPF